jgi:hypothetical protein
MNAALQMAVVMLLVAWSLWVMLGRFLPQVAVAMRLRLARLVAWRGANRLSRWLSRVPVASGGCGDGCGSCKTGCAPMALPAEQPVQWRQPPSGACH